MSTNRTSLVREPVLREILAALEEAAEESAPCPKNSDIGLIVGMSERRVSAGILHLREAGRIQIEYLPSPAYRRVRLLVQPAVGPIEAEWGPWTDWTAGPKRPVDTGTWAARRGDLIASVDTLSAGRDAIGPTRARIATLLAQGYPRATVMRLAGLKRHEMDLVFG